MKNSLSIITLLFTLAACDETPRADETSTTATVDPTTESSSSGSDETSSSSGDDGESSSSTGGEESSSSSGECLDVVEQPEPYAHCGSYCEGSCGGGRRCVNDSIDSDEPFDLASCSTECSTADQCEQLDGAPAAVCQIGQCFIPCDVGACPSGFECFEPSFANAVAVCLAVG